MSFRKDFVWGCATAAFQIEGGAEERGECVWDVFAKTPGKTFRGHDGDIACDHYHRFHEDVELMSQLHVKNYRFSVSWPRLLPQGTGEVNQKGLDFYDALVDDLLEHGIRPWMTLFHWDYPSALMDRGGWSNPDSVRWFADYAELIGRHFGDRVKDFIPLNEPQCFVGLGFRKGEHAPGYVYPDAVIVPLSHHVLLANGNAVRVLRREVPGCSVGYAPCGNAMIPVSGAPEDVDAARKAYFSVPDGSGWPFSTAWWSDPVIFGTYPADGLERFERFLPAGWEEDMTVIRSELDFYGQNIYNGTLIRAADNPGGWEAVLPFRGSPKTAIQWDIMPEALYWGPRFLYERYQTPFVITENGMSAHDVISLDGKVHDPNRIDYLNRFLLQYRRAAEDGVDAVGYFQWSLMDNFEWASGYSDRFGIVFVDYADHCRRVIKDSALWYRDIMDSNGEKL